MPTTKYITLKNSNNSVNKRFKAIAMNVPEQRTDGIEYTLSGKIDKASGPILKMYSYVLRVPEETQDDINWGTMANLRALFALTNPNATPTDVITLIDHYGTTHSCYFLGEMAPEPLTTMLEGPNAWHIVPINLQRIL